MYFVLEINLRLTTVKKRVQFIQQGMLSQAMTTAFVFRGIALSLLYAPVKYGTPLNGFLNEPLQIKANHNKGAYTKQYSTEPRKSSLQSTRKEKQRINVKTSQRPFRAWTDKQRNFYVCAKFY